MRYLLFPFAAFCLLLTALPAQAADVYADALVDASTANLLTPENAVGEPDSAYADFRDNDTFLTLDMGEGEEGLGDLTLYFYLYNYGATVRVTLLSNDGEIVFEDSQAIPLYEDSVAVGYTGSASYRFVKVESIEEEQWSLDAIEAEGYTSVEVAPPPPVEEEPIGTGSLIKLEGHPAVYVVGSDDKRHAFPNETVFGSWFEDFDDVVKIDSQTMASFPLGGNVTMRAGTLVKITTDPKVYAIEPGGVLRWITSEALAKDLYGEQWNQVIVDVNDVFWGNYTRGNDLIAAVHPDGTVLKEDDQGVIWSIENGLKFEMDAQTFELMEINERWVFEDQEDELDLYVDGGDFEMTDENRYPY